LAGASVGGKAAAVGAAASAAAWAAPAGGVGTGARSTDGRRARAAGGVGAAAGAIVLAPLLRRVGDVSGSSALRIGRLARVRLPEVWLPPKLFALVSEPGAALVGAALLAPGVLHPAALTRFLPGWG